MAPIFPKFFTLENFTKKYNKFMNKINCSLIISIKMIEESFTRYENFNSYWLVYRRPVFSSLSYAKPCINSCKEIFAYESMYNENFIFRSLVPTFFYWFNNFKIDFIDRKWEINVLQSLP